MSQDLWGVDNIPDQKGRVAVITGAAAGIGKEAARVLAQKNAKVVMAVRNVPKGQGVADTIRRECSGADIEVREMDLASLASIKSFAQSILRDYPRLDMLIDNAGVMMCPYEKTRDGFEIQFGTNHLGHFALTLQLLPLLQKTTDSRIVVVSSLAHRRGDLDFSDLQWERRKYSAGQAYCDSKLANLYFVHELARKLAAQGNNPLVTAAHPGWTATELQRHSWFYNFLNVFFAQNAAMGALPTLRAAIDAEAAPGDFFGPSQRSEVKGPPVKVESSVRSRDAEVARKLWMLSEQMAGITYVDG